MSQPPDEPRLEVVQVGDRTVAHPVGCDSLNEYTIGAVDRQLAGLAQALGGRVVLDLAGIAYLSSTALVRLVVLNKDLRTRGGRLTLANAGLGVREVLAVTCLDRVLELEPGP